MMEWKPIETAPNYLGKCLLFCPEMHNRRPNNLELSDGRVMGRIVDGHAYGNGMTGKWEFSHFALLPEPPELSERK